jgi:hypothetical protein
LGVNPGKDLNIYLNEDRRHLVAPLRLLLVSTTLVVLASFAILKPVENFRKGYEIGMNQGYTVENEQHELTAEQKEKMQKTLDFALKLEGMISKYYNLILMSSIPFMAFGSFLFFKKYSLNYAEHLVVNTYISSMQNVFFLICIPLFLISDKLMLVYVIPAYIYFIYAFKNLFKLPAWTAIWRSVFALIVGALFYTTTLIVFGIVYVVIFAMNA